MSKDKPAGDELQDARRPLIFIHSSIDDLTDLTPNAMRVYMHLARRAGKDNSAFPSYQSIGDHCFSSVSANQATRKSFARKAIDQLIEAGLIVKANRSTDGVNQSNVYKLVEPTQEEGGMPIKHTMPIGTPMPIKHTPVPIKHGVCLIGTKGSSSEGNPIEGTPQKGERSVAKQPPAQRTPPAPAVAIYEEIFERKANSNQRKAITDTVTDCAKWRDVLNTWALKGHSPTNIVDQLDVYANGWQRKGQSTNDHQPPPEPQPTRRMAQPIFAEE